MNCVTDMVCMNCGAEVYRIEGSYSCECSEVSIYMIEAGNENFFKYWTTPEDPGEPDEEDS